MSTSSLHPPPVAPPLPQAPTRAQHLRAARVVRLIARSAGALGAFVSAELAVRVGAELARPPVAVVPGDPPVDGVLAAPPPLVITFDPVTQRWWEAAGAGEVWRADADGVAVRGSPGRVVPPGVVRSTAVPGLMLPAALLLDLTAAHRA